MNNDTTLFRLLGGLFFYSPNSSQCQSILTAFSKQKDHGLQTLAQLANDCDTEILEADYFSLLQGDGDMPCPPWGSAYLDKDNALFGSSTIEYREFIRQFGIECDTGQREPEDHIGLMLMLVSVLLEQENTTAAQQLVSHHLMPFAPLMLDTMEKSANTGYYQQLAVLTQTWLSFYCQEHQLEITERRNYWKTSN